MTNFEKTQLYTRTKILMDIIIERNHMENTIPKLVLEIPEWQTNLTELEKNSLEFVALVCEQIARFIYRDNATREQLDFITNTVLDEFIDRQNRENGDFDFTF